MNLETPFAMHTDDEQQCYLIATLKPQLTTEADDIQKFFFIVFQRK